MACWGHKAQEDVPSTSPEVNSGNPLDDLVIDRGTWGSSLDRVQMTTKGMDNPYGWSPATLASAMVDERRGSQATFAGSEFGGSTRKDAPPRILNPWDRFDQQEALQREQEAAAAEAKRLEQERNRPSPSESELSDVSRDLSPEPLRNAAMPPLAELAPKKGFTYSTQAMDPRWSNVNSQAVDEGYYGGPGDHHVAQPNIYGGQQYQHPYPVDQLSMQQWPAAAQHGGNQWSGYQQPYGQTQQYAHAEPPFDDEGYASQSEHTHGAFLPYPKPTQVRDVRPAALAAEQDTYYTTQREAQRQVEAGHRTRQAELQKRAQYRQRHERQPAGVQHLQQSHHSGDSMNRVQQQPNNAQQMGYVTSPLDRRSMKSQASIQNDKARDAFAQGHRDDFNPHGDPRIATQRQPSHATSHESKHNTKINDRHATSKPTPTEKLHGIVQSFHADLHPRCEAFIAAPPRDAAARDKEYRFLSEMVLTKVLMEYDQVGAVDGASAPLDEATRALRKRCIRECNAVLERVDRANKDALEGKGRDEGALERKRTVGDAQSHVSVAGATAASGNIYSDLVSNARTGTRADPSWTTSGPAETKASADTYALPVRGGPAHSAHGPTDSQYRAQSRHVQPTAYGQAVAPRGETNEEYTSAHGPFTGAPTTTHQGQSREYGGDYRERVDRQQAGVRTGMRGDARHAHETRLAGGRAVASSAGAAAGAAPGAGVGARTAAADPSLHPTSYPSTNPSSMPIASLPGPVAMASQNRSFLPPPAPPSWHDGTQQLDARYESRPVVREARSVQKRAAAAAATLSSGRPESGGRARVDERAQRGGQASSSYRLQSHAHPDLHMTSHVDAASAAAPAAGTGKMYATHGHHDAAMGNARMGAGGMAHGTAGTRPREAGSVPGGRADMSQGSGRHGYSAGRGMGMIATEQGVYPRSATAAGGGSRGTAFERGGY